jgi:hypothetical protein
MLLNQAAGRVAPVSGMLAVSLSWHYRRICGEGSLLQLDLPQQSVTCFCSSSFFFSGGSTFRRFGIEKDL